MASTEQRGRHRRPRAAVGLVGVLAVGVLAACNAIVPDPAWNGGQPVRFRMPLRVEVTEVVSAPGGGVYATQIAATTDGVERYDSAGAAVPGFDGTGLRDARYLPLPSGALMQAAYTKQWMFRPDSLEQHALYRINRLGPDGAPDPSYASVSVDLGPTTEARDVRFAVDAAGRTVVAVRRSSTGELRRYDTAGALDPAFGTGGILATPVPSALAVVGDVPVIAEAGTGRILALDAAGATVWSRTVPGLGSAQHLVVAGSTIVAASDVAAGTVTVARLSTSGVLDPSFDGDGVRTEPAPAGTTALTPPAVAADGTIVLPYLAPVGGDTLSQYPAIVLTRLTATGATDGAWGAGGTVVFDRTAAGALPFTGGAKNAGTHRVVVADAGGYLIATTTWRGFSANEPDPDGGLTRLDASGQVDVGHGVGGTAPAGTALLATTTAEAVVALPGGEAIAVIGDFPYTRLARFTAAGELDQSYGTGGLGDRVMSTPVSSALDAAADGSALLASSYRPLSGGATTTSVKRFTATGSLDRTYGSAGFAVLTPPAAAPGTRLEVSNVGVVATPTGAVALLDISVNVSPGQGLLGALNCLYRLTASGQVSAPVCVAGSGAALAVDADGSIVHATVGFNELVVSVRRWTAELTPVATFGAGGVSVSTLPAGVPVDRPSVLRIGGDGRIVVGTRSHLSALRPDGTVDPTFNGGQWLGLFHRDVEIDPQGRLLLLTSATGSPFTASLHRLTAAGVADTTFGSGGRRTLDRQHLTVGRALALAPGGGAFLAGYDPDDATKGAAVIKVLTPP